MMKYPIGIQTFSNIIQDGYVYVDKTDMVYSLANSGKIFFLSRPRRFGKSLLLSTLKSYFLGQKELFRGLKIDSLEKEWNVYPVFHLSFGKGIFSMPYELDKNLETFVAMGEREYGKDELATTISERFAAVIKAAHKKMGRRAVVLIDEYDKPLLDVMDQEIFVEDESGNTVSFNEVPTNEEIAKKNELSGPEDLSLSVDDGISFPSPEEPAETSVEQEAVQSQEGFETASLDEFQEPAADESNQIRKTENSLPRKEPFAMGTPSSRPSSDIIPVEALRQSLQQEQQFVAIIPPIARSSIMSSVIELAREMFSPS